MEAQFMIIAMLIEDLFDNIVFSNQIEISLETPIWTVYEDLYHLSFMLGMNAIPWNLSPYFSANTKSLIYSLIVMYMVVFSVLIFLYQTPDLPLFRMYHPPQQYLVLSKLDKISNGSEICKQAV